MLSSSLFLISSYTTSAQVTIKGQILSSDSGKGCINAHEMSAGRMMALYKDKDTTALEEQCEDVVYTRGLYICLISFTS